MLELKLLRSGATQHVFSRADDEDDPWVYKTPALLDELLPGRINLRRLRPVRRFSSLVYLAAYQLPRTAWHVTSRATSAPAGPPHHFARLLLSCRSSYLAGVSRLYALYLRRARVRQFHRVLALHDRIASTCAAGVLLPFRTVPRARARLLVGLRTIDYCGPVIQQRRADAFFDTIEDIPRFGWDALIDGEHRLWRVGAGIGDGATAIGPFGWCLHDGQVRLADTGSLSTSLPQVRHCLGEVVDDRWRHRLERLEGERQRIAHAYFAHVRPHLSATTLRRLWRSGTSAPDSSSRTGT